MELFKQRLREILYIPLRLLGIMLMMVAMVAPFLTIEYFFEGWGVGLVAIMVVGTLIYTFIDSLIIDPFFKKK